MPKCSFCRKDIPPGTGVMLVKKDGKTLYFCSSKCEKNLLKLKRKPQNQKWVVKKK
ncbi:MAG TPA: 50S ribosomal protein L24e [Candidatus Woesearchaeota archaeon]|nr:MAG: 50S ribosomal protein L24e [Candidatus Woesearchaeota archaeon]HDD70599.1 50S ribosomal protein L24e [Candidatus Woesearchaeota archaeon]